MLLHAHTSFRRNSSVHFSPQRIALSYVVDSAFHLYFISLYSFICLSKQQHPQKKKKKKEKSFIKQGKEEKMKEKLFFAYNSIMKMKTEREKSI